MSGEALEVGKSRLAYWERWSSLVRDKPELKAVFNEALDIFDQYEGVIAVTETRLSDSEAARAKAREIMQKVLFAFLHDAMRRTY